MIGVTALNDARELQQEQLVHWASQPERADDPSIFRSELEGSFQVRVAAMTGQILAVYVKGALDTRDPTIGRGAADADSSRVSFGGETVLDYLPERTGEATAGQPMAPPIAVDAEPPCEPPRPSPSLSW